MALPALLVLPAFIHSIRPVAASQCCSGFRTSSIYIPTGFIALSIFFYFVNSTNMDNLITHMKGEKELSDTGFAALIMEVKFDAAFYINIDSCYNSMKITLCRVHFSLKIILSGRER